MAYQKLSQRFGSWLSSAIPLLYANCCKHFDSYPEIQLITLMKMKKRGKKRFANLK
jgi:hypothetical protein